MPHSISLDDLGEQLLAELLIAPKTSVPRFYAMEDGFAAIGTHVGGKRPRNEDRAAIARVDFGNRYTYTLFIVCDGVGGSQRGDEAAAIACAAMISRLSTVKGHRLPAQLLFDLIREADDVVRDRLAGSGQTTICALLNSSQGSCALASVGDSRAYSWDHGSELIQLTEDDTLANEMKHLNPQAKTFLNERGLEGSLSQALGERGRASNDLNINIITEKDLPPGGILLATDGVWVNDENAFQKVAKNSQSTTELMRRLITSAFWLGGVDNASAIAIKDPQQIPPAPEPTQHHTRVTLWLTDKQVVAYRPLAEAPAAAPVLRDASEKQLKKRRKKTEAKADQLKLPETEQSPKGNTIVAGPDDS